MILIARSAQIWRTFAHCEVRSGTVLGEATLEVLHPHLPHNFDRALGQFRSLVGQLKRGPVKFKHYDKVIQDQVKMGFVEKVEVNRPKLVACHYLPHHSVAKESSSTPLRVVFNCSSKSGLQQISLNDCLMTGPP